MGREIILKKTDALQWHPLPGGFKYKWIAEGNKFLTGMGLAEPGGGETWHKHTKEVEETYYVLRGKGTIWWRVEGKEYSLDFSEGDSMYLPPGCENQFVNTGEGELLLLFNLTKADKMRE